MVIGPDFSILKYILDDENIHPLNAAGETHEFYQSYKFKLKLNVLQLAILATIAGSARFVYNKALAECIKLYKVYKQAQQAANTSQAGNTDQVVNTDQAGSTEQVISTGQVVNTNQAVNTDQVVNVDRVVNTDKNQKTDISKKAKRPVEKKQGLKATVKPGTTKNKKVKPKSKPKQKTLDKERKNNIRKSRRSEKLSAKQQKKQRINRKDKRKATLTEDRLFLQDKRIQLKNRRKPKLEKSQCDLNKSQLELDSIQNELKKSQCDLDKNQLERDSIQNELKKSQCDLDKNQLERDSIQNGLEKSQCDLDKKQLELELSIKLNKARESQLQDNERKLKEDRLVLEAKKIKLKQKHAQLQKKHDREKGRGELEENQLDLAEHALKEEEHINEFADTHFKREAIKHWLKNKHNDCENKLKQIEKPFKSTENQVDLEKISIELEAELNALEEKWYQSAIDWLNLEDTRNHLEKKQLELKAKLGKLKKNRIQLENKRNLAECRSDSEKKHDDIAKYKLKADKNLIEFADTHFKLEAIRHRLKNNHSDSENQLEQVEKPFEFTENQIDLEKSSIENEAALNALAKKWGQFAMRLLDLKARDELETKQIALKEEQLKLEDKSRFSAIDLCAKTTEWRNDPKTAWLSKAPAHVLQQSVMDLDKGFTNYYAGRAGFPRFKKKGQSESFRYPDPKQIKFDQKNSRIFLPKIGWVGYHNSREVQGEIKYVTVSKDAGEWYISITTLHKVKNISLAEQDVSGIAIDVGVVLLAALSDGTVYPSLEKLKKLEVQLNKAQRALSRKEEGSENWKKNCAEIQRIYATARNVRRDYLHKITTTIAKNHGVVCIEDLNVQNMSKSAAGTLEEPGKNVKAKSGLNRAILRQGWGEFFRMLEYKLERRGGLLIAVPPQYTSQTCPCCGHVSADNRKTQAKFHCVSCGFEENADVVGAINVHIKGINVLVEQRDVLRNQLQILQSNAPADCLETINSINKISDCVLQLNSGINALVDSLKIKKRRAGSASQSVESGSRSVKQKPTEALSAAGTLDF